VTAPKTLGELAVVLKSNNAGAVTLTFDIGFADEDHYQRVITSGVIRPELFAETYGVARADVRIYHVDRALALKISIPRACLLGAPEESDFDGTQQFVPLLSVVVPPVR